MNPEFSARAVILGIILSVILGAANIYFGLYAGMTVSASIPAAVISIGIFRLLRVRAHTLEHNMVQSIASAGESLAAGVIFTIPALVICGAWKEYSWWATTGIATAGGLLGVVFMVPLRRALITGSDPVQIPLTFPEGTACATVLKSSDNPENFRALVTGLIFGSVAKILSSYFHLASETLKTVVQSGGRSWLLASDSSAALIAVGWIIRWRIAILVFAGGVVSNWILLPWFSLHVPESGIRELLNTRIRTAGAAAILLGGIYSLFAARKGLITALRYLIPREETRDNENISARGLLIIFSIAILLSGVIYIWLIKNFLIALLTLAVMAVGAFLFSTVATYAAGLVGSSNSPVSGMTICALLLAALILLAAGFHGDSAMLSILGVAGVVCCSTCIAGDISQDLKTGQLVGASPRKQQWGEILGVLASALVFAPVLTLLHHTYGIGTGQPGALAAPQAGLFAGLAKSLSGDLNLPWDAVFSGAVAGAIFILIDLALASRKKPGFRFHPMPVAIGMYLPFGLVVPMLLGGLLAAAGRGDSIRTTSAASGMIAGEALAGILIAILAAFWPPFPELPWAGIGVPVILLGALLILRKYVPRGR